MPRTNQTKDVICKPFDRLQWKKQHKLTVQKKNERVSVSYCTSRVWDYRAMASTISSQYIFSILHSIILIYFNINRFLCECVLRLCFVCSANCLLKIYFEILFFFSFLLRLNSSNMWAKERQERERKRHKFFYTFYLWMAIDFRFNLWSVTLFHRFDLY